MTVKITESSLKRIIREELERLAEAPEPKTLSAWYDSKGMSLPSLKARRRLAQQLGLDPKTIGTSKGNTALLNKLIQGDKEKTVDLKDLAPSKPEVEGQAETLEDRAIKMLQFYDTAVYGKSLGPFISKYNSLPGGPLFIRAGARFAGDLGMLDEMPTNLKGLKAVSRRFLPETGDDFVDEALVIAHRLVKDLDYNARTELANMLTQAMSGGHTPDEISDALTHLEYLEDRVKKQFVSYGSDSDRKKARTKNKQQRVLIKLLKQVKKRGPSAEVIIQKLNEQDASDPYFSDDEEFMNQGATDTAGGRKLISGNVLSKFITDKSTPAKISQKLKAFSRLHMDATGAADSMLDGASRLHDMMKKDPKAAEYIKEFVLFNTGQ